MHDLDDTISLTLQQRLGCLLAVTEKEADILIHKGSVAVDTVAIGKRIGLTRIDVDKIVSSPSTIKEARIDANKVNQLQLQQVPFMALERIRQVSEGKPYFSLQEFEEASGLPKAVISQLFTIPKLELLDKVTQKSQRFEPVFGKYIALPRLEFESLQQIEAIGFAELSQDTNSSVRVIVPSDIEAQKKSYELKRLLGSQVSPVVRDQEGFERYFVPASIEIWFRPDTPKDRAVAVLNELGLRVIMAREKIGYYQTDLASPPADFHVLAETLKMIQKTQKHAEIDFAEPTEVGFEDFKPENENILPDFESASDSSRTWNMDAIELEAAHDIVEGSANVTILVVDSGIRSDHQDLYGALRPDWATLDLNFDLDVPELELSPLELDIAHGTKVASVACGRGPEGETRVRGVAPGCWLLPIKISGSPYGQSYGLRAVAIREAIDYITKDMRGVLNISWSTNGEHIGVREALFKASEKGIAITTSAGNYSFAESQIPNKIHYPSQYAFLPGDSEADIQARRKIPGLVSVAAVNSLKKKASYSYYGDHSVTISAPGGEPGLIGTGVFVASTPDAYAYEAGTSFSAPHVAGLLALLFSAKAQLSAQQAISVICASATDLDAYNPSFTGMLGAGLINARAALESLDMPGSSAETTPPIVIPIAEDSNGLVNINVANVTEINALPFIGEWSAHVIVAYRLAHGPFNTIWDLTKTGAVNYWTIEQIQHLITIAPASASVIIEPPQNLFPPETTQGLININTATPQQLTAIPFIGDWCANKIVNYRDTHGPFATINDLLLTGAVDSWIIEQIKHLITVIP